MADERAPLEVGAVVKAHGLRGQVIVHLWTDRVERLDPHSELSTARGVLVVEAAAAHQDRFIVSFEGVTTREAAERLRGVVLSAPPIEDDEVIWIDQLFGAQVVDTAGVEHGTVIEVEANPASDLLVLDSGQLVPLTFVTEVEANRRVVVDAPEGLFE
ncbi:MAG TPA: ribosome maturation factor RimM [Acidimicrobiales bacterium]|nr:ribosome maturation factor RimM [Acidimicrobiales bacterium]